MSFPFPHASAGAGSDSASYAYTLQPSALLPFSLLAALLFLMRAWYRRLELGRLRNASDLVVAIARPGEEIMQIVPVDDDLIIEAKVRPADIAFVKPGLSAAIKLDAYDCSMYGALQGGAVTSVRIR